MRKVTILFFAIFDTFFHKSKLPSAPDLTIDLANRKPQRFRTDWFDGDKDK